MLKSFENFMDEHSGDVHEFIRSSVFVYDYFVFNGELKVKNCKKEDKVCILVKDLIQLLLLPYEELMKKMKNIRLD